MNEASIIASGIELSPAIPVKARSESSETVSAETPFIETGSKEAAAPETLKSPAFHPPRPRGRVSANSKSTEKLREALPIDSRDPKTVNAAGTAPVETQAPTRPNVGTNEAPIFE
jgi:hypothetical protein